MFLSFVAIISTLAFASSLTLNKVKGTQNLEKSELGKRIVQGIIAKIEEKTNLRPESNEQKVDKKVEGFNFADGYIVSTFTSGAPSSRIIAQQTFTGGIYGPYTVTLTGGTSGTVWVRLQFDTAAQNQFQALTYSANPTSASAPLLFTTTGTLDSLVTETSTATNVPSEIRAYEYVPNSNTAAGVSILGGSATVKTTYYPLTSAPSYPVAIPQTYYTVALFGNTFYSAQISTSVYNVGSVSYQFYTGIIPSTKFPTSAPVQTPYPTFTASPSVKPVPQPSFGFTFGATYDLIQYTGANGQGTASYVTDTFAPEGYSTTLAGPFTYPTPFQNEAGVTVATLTFTYNNYLNTGSSSSSSSGVCFSGSSEVAMESGAIKQISEVVVGDRVLAYSTKTESAVFSSVVAVPHNKNNKVAEFIQITTESGKVIKMTSEHFIQSCEGLVAASKISSGACVVTVDGQENVSGVEKVVEEGLYTVVTEEELVVVNGVVASPFAVNHFIPNMFYNFHRFAFGLLPSFLSTKMMESVSTVADEVAQYYTVATDSL